MRSVLLTVGLGVLLIAFAGCQKDNEDATAVANSLIGSWELRASQAGMLPGRELSPGNGTVLQFSATHYTKYENHVAVQTGKYSLIKDSTVSTAVGLLVPAGKFGYRIVMENDENKRSTFIDLEEYRLSLVTGYFPLDYGVFRQYEKIATPPPMFK